MAIKDEVEDLEKAGITVIQIDEAALREGLPLRKSEQAFYLDWAVHSFRITNCGVKNTTQVQMLIAVAALKAFTHIFSLAGMVVDLRRKKFSLRNIDYPSLLPNYFITDLFSLYKSL